MHPCSVIPTPLLPCTPCTVEGWRLKWGLTSQLEGAGETEVVEALCNPSEGVRLNALYHCAKTAMALQTAAHKQARRRSSVREGEGKGDMFGPLYTYVAPVERLLKDSSVSIKVAAVVWLTVVGRWSEKVCRGFVGKTQKWQEFAMK